MAVWINLGDIKMSQMPKYGSNPEGCLSGIYATVISSKSLYYRTLAWTFLNWNSQLLKENIYSSFPLTWPAVRSYVRLV